jgi:hypothetical protein
MPVTPDSVALLVLGSPRSGTSAISHFLNQCGFDFGNPAHFVDTDTHRHNPIFFELEWVNRLNERVLARLGAGFPHGCPPTVEAYATSELDELAEETKSSIAREWPSSRRIGVKDPRFCFTLPFWRRVLAEMGMEIRLVWSLRSPSATIASNAKLLPDWTTRRVCELWTRCVLSGRHVIGDTPFIPLDYDRMMGDPVRFAEEAVSRLGLDIADVARTVSHISSSHRHQSPGPMIGFPEVDEIDTRFRAGLLSSDEYRVYRRFAKLFDADAEHIADHREYERLSRERIDLIHSLEGQLRERFELLAEQQRQSAALADVQAGHIEKLTASYREAEEQRAVLAHRLRDLQDHVERQTAQSLEIRDSQRLHIQKLEAAYSAAEEARGRFEDEASDLRAVLDAQSAQSTELQDSLRAHIGKLEAMYREAEVQRSGLVQENTDLAQHLELKNRQSTEFQESQRRHIEKLETLYADTERRRAWLAQEAAQNTAEIGRLRDAIAEMKSALVHREGLLLEELERGAEQRGVWLPFGSSGWADGMRRFLHKRRAA